ncbi:MAG: hypothetical protein JSS35_09695 [Proteobacteria bacterium]|nr:hypothetical protein [Pseudomonadota bacterium]
MSDYALNTVSFQTTAQIQQTQPATPPRPPKSQSDHEPANTSESSRGPAVVLSGAFAQSTGGKRDTGSQTSGRGGASPPQQSSPQATGQHVNHVI